MPVEPCYAWGVKRWNLDPRKPAFLLAKAFHSRKEALDWVLWNYGSEPNREAALKRHRRTEGIRVVRVVLRAFGDARQPQDGA